MFADTERLPTTTGYYDKYSMKILEVTKDIDEGWKSNLAKAGISAALAFSGPGITDKTSPPKQSVQAPKPASIVDLLRQAAHRAGIEGQELAQFLSQAAHETLNFTRMAEAGTQEYLRKKYDIEHNPRKAKILGNTRPGDGVKFKGRGYVQLTGRYNYSMAEKELDLPLLTHPELASRPDVAAQIAVWYWNKRVKPNVKDFTNVEQSTKHINPGMKGMKSRKKQYDKFKNEVKPK